MENPLSRNNWLPNLIFVSFSTEKLKFKIFFEGLMAFSKWIFICLVLSQTSDRAEFGSGERFSGVS